MPLNPILREFLKHSPKNRKDIYLLAGARLQAEPAAMEKDFFVCLVLDMIYHGRPESHPRMLFKGGTSLSKGYNLIHRFSEDIDMVVFPEDLGVKDPYEPDISKKETRRRLETLQAEASRYITEDLREILRQLVEPVAPSCTFESKADLHGPVLLLRYESVFEGMAGYISPEVKIEGGARSALNPHEHLSVLPYVATEFGADAVPWAIEGVTTIRPERTFLEKLMAMHGWLGKRDSMSGDQGLRQRISRHYFDVALIAKTETGQAAMADRGMLEDVRTHSMRAFGAKALADAVPGSIRLVPAGEALGELAKDYEAMQGMIFGASPRFEDVLKAVAEVESRVNTLETDDGQAAN